MVPAADDWPIPTQLADACKKTPERAAWLAQLPNVLTQLKRRWALSVGTPFEGAEVSCSWVAPVERADGTRAVLKIGMPHMEGAHEIAGLRFWNGDATARILEADEGNGAMLLERCQPGTPLRDRPEPEQDEVIAGLLRRLWRVPAPGHTFRPLSAMVDHWSEETEANAARWPDPGLVRAGLRLFRELPRQSTAEVLLATDLHAGNVLRAQREPWLVIDPKPFVGDPAYDATQHLLNCAGRLRADALGTIHRMADLLDVRRERVRLWMFARLVAGAREEWSAQDMTLARAVAP